MKKILLAFTAILFLLIYVISSSEPMMKIIAQYRYRTNAFFGSDKYAYGDLYGLSYLPQFRIKQPPNGVIPVTVPLNNRDINLFALVDSHVFSFLKSDTVLYGVKNYWFSTWNDYGDQQHVKIDTNQKNVLLLEIVEHNSQLLADSNYVLNKMTATSQVQPVPQHVRKSTPEPFGDRLRDIFFEKNIKENLEFNLFNYRFFSLIKELKAALDYKIFDRVDKDVQVSGNGKYLYIKSTVDTNYESSFYPVKQKKIDDMVAALNEVDAHYKAIGFDDVYLAMIPNPVSMLEPGAHYNHLVERVQHDPRLKMKFIDMYDIYKTPQGQIYKNSDTHYTNYGYQLFIEELNKQLSKLDEIKK